MQGNKIVLGTRGSELARAQTRLVEEALHSSLPEIDLEIRVIKTAGDKIPNEFFGARGGRKGIFTREIEEKLRGREIDVAVHSAKDLPSSSPNDLKICATLARAEVQDVLLMKSNISLQSMPAQARIATGSVRRRYQLQWKRPDLQLVDLRGNVPTRLRKFIENDWDAIVLARAGLQRLGYELNRGVLNFDGQALSVAQLLTADFLPAGGQGIIAIQVRCDDTETAQRVQAINHASTLSCLSAEREFLRLLQVDCNAPVGVLATIESEIVTLRAQVFGEQKGEPQIGETKLSLQEHEPKAIAATLYGLMYGQD